MPALSESFLANKNFTFLAAALAFLAAAVLVSVIFRLISTRKLRLPRNGRARLPRLGTVDSFDLDRQRQLVIIRRDNVEHLLMIGGPNDLLIESQIIRAESRDQRDVRDNRIRDKDVREKDPRDAPQPSMGMSWTAPADVPFPIAAERRTPFFPAEPELLSHGNHALPVEDLPPVIPPKTVSPVRPSVFPVPPRRASPPLSPSSQRGTPQRDPLNGRAEPSPRSEPMTGAARELRRASLATPFLRSASQRQSDGAAFKTEPSGAAPETPTPASPPANTEESPAAAKAHTEAVTGSSPSVPATHPEAPAMAVAELVQSRPAEGPAPMPADTLEAEMAKLLGRGPG